MLEEHQHLRPWTGKDRDFVVRDESGKLEQWLRDASYNDFPEFDKLDSSSSVADSTIEYLIEVKTALKECDEHFYMSDAQFQKVSVARCDLRRDLMAPNIASRLLIAVNR